jgi:hypothetical protein
VPTVLRIENGGIKARAEKYKDFQNRDILSKIVE